MTPDGLVTCTGGFSPKESTTLPLRPRSVMELRPTEVLIFGNARGARR
jgi:hypothetical protein